MPGVLFVFSLLGSHFDMPQSLKAAASHPEKSGYVFTLSRKAMSLLIMKVWRRCMILMNVRERRAILPPSPFCMQFENKQTSFPSRVPSTNCVFVFSTISFIRFHESQSVLCDFASSGMGSFLARAMTTSILGIQGYLPILLCLSFVSPVLYRAEV